MSSLNNKQNQPMVIEIKIVVTLGESWLGRVERRLYDVIRILFQRVHIVVFTLKKYIELHHYDLWTFLDTSLHFNKKFKWKQNVTAVCLGLPSYLVPGLYRVHLTSISSVCPLYQPGIHPLAPINLFLNLPSNVGAQPTIHRVNNQRRGRVSELRIQLCQQELLRWQDLQRNGRVLLHSMQSISIPKIH